MTNTEDQRIHNTDIWVNTIGLYDKYRGSTLRTFGSIQYQGLHNRDIWVNTIGLYDKYRGSTRITRQRHLSQYNKIT